MHYFDRSIKMANILFAIGGFFLFVTLIFLFKDDNVYDQVIVYSNGNFVRGAIYFMGSLVLGISSFLAGICMRCVAKDAKEEIESMKKELRVDLNKSK